MPRTERITLDLPVSTVELLRRLQKRLPIDGDAEVVEQALALYSRFWGFLEDDEQAFVTWARSLVREFVTDSTERYDEDEEDDDAEPEGELFDILRRCGYR